MRPSVIDDVLAFAPGSASTSAGFDEDLFRGLVELERGNFWFEARNELVAWAMRTFAPKLESFLEIGCGTGFVLARIRSEFPSIDLYGSEIFSAGLAFTAQRVRTATLYQMDACHIPFEDEFTGVGAFDVLEHIDDDGLVMEAVWRALRPGGFFFATVPQHMALWSAQDIAAHHVRRYSATELRRKVARTGFEVLRMTSFTSLLLPAMAIARKAGRKSASELDGMDGLRLPGALNAILSAAMRVESAVVRAGVSLPVGGLCSSLPGSPREGRHSQLR